MTNKTTSRIAFFIFFLLMFTFLSCQKNDYPVKSATNNQETQKLADLKFFLTTVLNVSPADVLYDSEKKQFTVYDQKFSLSDIDKRFNESNEFKIRYRLTR